MSGIRRTRRTCDNSGCPAKRRPLLIIMLSISSRTNVGDKVLVRKNCNCSPSMRRQRSSKTYMNQVSSLLDLMKCKESNLQSVIGKLGHLNLVAINLDTRERFGIIRQLFCMHKLVTADNTLQPVSTYCLHLILFRKSKPPVAGA